MDPQSNSRVNRDRLPRSGSLPEPLIDEFYLADPRALLVPIEHLSPRGLSEQYVEFLTTRAANGEAIARTLNQAFPLYWSRTSKLATHTRTWAHPRIRNIAVVDSSSGIPPYVQLLNTTTWTLFDADFAGQAVEFVVYLLVHGDRMSLTGDATNAALYNAAYWFDRSNEEINAFQSAARASKRPDAEAFALLAAAVPWLQRLAHESLRPPASHTGYRAIARSELFVPREVEGKPVDLLNDWKRIATRTLNRYYKPDSRPDRRVLADTLDWLREDQPEVLVTSNKNRIVWDPNRPERLGSLRSELRNSSAPALRSIRQDLATINQHSADFRSRCAGITNLPLPDERIAQNGYTYLYRGRGILAYNLRETHLERLRVPSLPYARSMLGARAYHEWCHLAVEAGCVQSQKGCQAALIEVREAFDATLHAAPSFAITVAQDDLKDLLRKNPPAEALDWGGEMIDVPGATLGAALLRMLIPRFVDYKANLLASHMQSTDERETYVRQNIRTLRGEYGRGQIWKMLARYLYELQYLRFSDIIDRKRFFSTSTWFEADFLTPGVLSHESFDRIDQAFGAVIDSLKIDPQKIDTSPG